MSETTVPGEPVKKEERKEPTALTMKLIEHHKQAEYHHNYAAMHHNEAYQYLASGDVEKAAESARNAVDHQSLAQKQQQEINVVLATKSF